MTLIYQYKEMNDLHNLVPNDKIQITDGSGGDSGPVFFVQYLGTKIFFSHQINYSPCAKYLKTNADYKTIKIFKL